MRVLVLELADETVNGDAKAVLERLERAGKIPLYPRELCQSTGLERESVIDALTELQAAGLVTAATFRATNGKNERNGNGSTDT